MNKLGKKPLLANKKIAITLLVLFFPLGIYVIWKYNLWSMKARSIITAGFAAYTLLFGVGVYNAPPTVTLSSVNSSQIVRTDNESYIVKGNVSSFHSAKATINGEFLDVDEYGDFEKSLRLKEGENKIKIAAVSAKGTDVKEFVIYRTTTAELAERKRLADEKKAKELAAKEAAAKTIEKKVADRKAKEDSAQDLDRTGRLYRVASITDGDTIKVSIDGKSETIRFIGMDTPETKDPRKPVQCFGKEAASKMQSLVQSKYVRLKLDNTQDSRDKYNRLLRYVFLEDGRNVAYEMIKGGYAHEYTYSTPYKYQPQFKAAEKFARDNDKGLWATTTCNGNTNQQHASSKPQTQPAPKPVPAPAPKPAPKPSNNCDPNYTPCVPNVSYDLDCGDIGFTVRIVGTDRHRFDREGDGYGCE